MFGDYDHITNQQYKIKTLERQVAAFKSGEKYKKLRKSHRADLAKKDCEIRRLQTALGKSESEIVRMRVSWNEVYDDICAEHDRQLSAKDKEIARLRERLWKAENRADEAYDKYRDTLTELYEVKTELEDERGRNAKLVAQINRNFENSSIPSSQSVNKKKISNSREKTGRKPGGQTGHEGHKRKQHTPDRIIKIPAPDKYARSSNFKPTGKTITKQLVSVKLLIHVDQYETPEYINLITKQRVHADFPAGMVNEVCYDGGVKAFAFLLNSYCNASIEKTRRLLSMLTNGKLEISTGLINGLCKEFSAKTEAERNAAISDLLLEPVMNTDFTNVRVNGKSAQVLVCATDNQVVYFAREHKGHKGVADTPIEDYQGILVHDHDKTFYSYGRAHQECNAHALRYLLDSIQNEQGLTWNIRMRDLLRKMIHYRKQCDGNIIDEDQIAEFEREYQEILSIAEREYDYEPPSKYYSDGYNLYLRLKEYKDSHLLFLRNPLVPTDNNLSERLLRVVKRKQKQVMSFRSLDGLANYCNALGVVKTLLTKDEDIYSGITDIFNR